MVSLGALRYRFNYNLINTIKYFQTQRLIENQGLLNICWPHVYLSVGIERSSNHFKGDIGLAGRVPESLLALKPELPSLISNFQLGTDPTQFPKIPPIGNLTSAAYLKLRNQGQRRKQWNVEYIHIFVITIFVNVLVNFIEE